MKRASAFLFDFIMRVMLVTGFAVVFSAIFGYDAKVERIEEYYDEYEEIYDIDIDISNAEYTLLPDDVKERYMAAEEAFRSNPEVARLSALILNLTLLISIFGILFAYIALEFVVPLLFGNGQTLGKKMFGIGVMRDDGVKITPAMLFVRSILGKCTIEALVPLAIIMLIFLGNAGIFGFIALILLAALEIFLMARTKTNSCIHDVLSYSVTVDMASQMIFESEEALVEYKNKLHAEAVDRTDY